MKRLAKRTTLFLALAALAAAPALASLQKNEEQHGARYFTWRFGPASYVGVQLLELTPELRAHFGVAEDSGVMVARVEEGGPAEAAGVLVGDILTAVDGEEVASSRQISRAIRDKREGDTVSIQLWRQGTERTVSVTVSERERRVLDLADFNFVPDHDVVIRPRIRLGAESLQGLDEAMRELETRFESEEWRDKLERLQELDFTKIQERMREVERRLKELEEELAREEGKK